MPDGREAAGGLEEEGDAGFFQAGESRAGHVAHGPADDERFGKGGMDGGDFLRHLQGPVGSGDGEI